MTKKNKKVKECCENCKWCSGNFDYYVGAECRRFPAQLFLVKRKIETQEIGETIEEIEERFPRVFRENFCGEFKKYS